jgi:hypothetical protein
MTWARDRTGGYLCFSFLFSLQLCFCVIFICCIVMGSRRVSIIALSVWRWLASDFFTLGPQKRERAGRRWRNISHFTYSCLYFIFTSAVGCLYLSLYTLFTYLSLFQQLIYKCIPPFILAWPNLSWRDTTVFVKRGRSCATPIRRDDNQQNC